MHVPPTEEIYVLRVSKSWHNITLSPLPWTFSSYDIVTIFAVTYKYFQMHVSSVSKIRAFLDIWKNNECSDTKHFTVVVESVYMHFLWLNNLFCQSKQQKMLMVMQSELPPLCDAPHFPSVFIWRCESLTVILWPPSSKEAWWWWRCE